MVDRPSEQHLNDLHEVYLTLDRMSEYVTGMDAWFVDGMLDATETAIERVENALEAKRQDAIEEREAEIEAEADRLVAAMVEAVQEVESADG